MLRLRSCCWLLAAFAMGCVPPASAQDKPFRAGAVAGDITPTKFPISVNGGMQDRLAKGAHDRRWKIKPGSALLAAPFGGTARVRMNPGYHPPDLVEPAGPTDPAITMLSVQTPEGRPIALLANYSLHYVGGLPALSADYFG